MDITLPHLLRAAAGITEQRLLRAAVGIITLLVHRAVDMPGLRQVRRVDIITGRLFALRTAAEQIEAKNITLIFSLYFYEK